MLKPLYISIILVATCINFGFPQLAKSQTNQYAEAKKALEKIWETDQGIRQKMTPYIQKGEINSPKFKELARLMKMIDEENLKIVINLIYRYGWLGTEDVGFQNSQALFLVIQHADLATQEKYLPAVKRAAVEGKTLPSNMALLEDRILMRQGKKQIYGSQVWVYAKTKAKFLYPLEDPENVDALRTKAGLNPISEYLEKSFQMKWNVKDYIKSLPQIEELIKTDKEEKARKAAENDLKVLKQ